VRLLDGWSCHTVTARGPEEIGPALDQMERRPDIVLADYHLDQGKTGLAALEEFHRRAGMEIPAVVITADRGAAIAAEVEAAGCELMHKPVRPAELRALMTHLLGQRTAS